MVYQMCGINWQCMFSEAVYMWTTCIVFLLFWINNGVMICKVSDMHILQSEVAIEIHVCI